MTRKPRYGERDAVPEGDELEPAEGRGRSARKRADHELTT